jgi:hypothetical protein
MSLIAAARPARPRSLLPREHGAYGQLALPLVAALAMGSPTAASAMLVVAATAAFAAHEPALVLAGLRGTRAQREAGDRATRLAVVCAAVAMVGAVGAAVLGGAVVVVASAVPVGLALALLPFIVDHEERSTAGEVLAGAALAAASIPVAVAGGVAIEVAIAAWGAWATAFTAATSAVRWIIARHRTGHGPPTLALLTIASTIVALAMATVWTVALAAIPTIFLAWILVARPPSPRHLKRVGWSLVASTATTALFIVLLTSAIA